jgi:hypothetical protein
MRSSVIKGQVRLALKAFEDGRGSGIHNKNGQSRPFLKLGNRHWVQTGFHDDSTSRMPAVSLCGMVANSTSTIFVWSTNQCSYQLTDVAALLEIKTNNNTNYAGVQTPVEMRSQHPRTHI